MSNSLFDLARLQPLRVRLDNHPIYAAVTGMDELRLFMAHHIYSVWDFMSLLKAIQQVVAPAGSPWLPGGDTELRRFVNEIVLEEETDEALPDANGVKGFISHFELYIAAMREVGADWETPLGFVDTVRREGVRAGLALPSVPNPSRVFMQSTFAMIDSGKPHVVAAGLALGREHIIPNMFRALLGRMRITEQEAPQFHYYLNRHIHLDEDFHAPLSLRLLESLCQGDPVKLAETEQAARQAIEARIAFWDGVMASFETPKVALAG